MSERSYFQRSALVQAVRYDAELKPKSSSAVHSVNMTRMHGRSILGHYVCAVAKRPQNRVAGLDNIDGSHGGDVASDSGDVKLSRQRVRCVQLTRTNVNIPDCTWSMDDMLTVAAVSYHLPVELTVNLTVKSITVMHKQMNEVITDSAQHDEQYSR